MKLNVKVFARAALCAGTLVAAALLASCGGGQQVSNFQPNRIIAFGDEFSVITSTGNKYTVNALLSGSSTAVDCTANPLWIQIVANNYNLVFPQCNSTLTPNPTSQIWATPGAMVADLSTQIDEQLNAGGFTSSDLVTVFVGANDIVAQFNTYPSVSQTQLTTNVSASGAALAAQVNRIAGYGAKVIIVTVPLMGLTPYAGSRATDATNPNPAILNSLSNSFNDALLSNLLNNGHEIGLVQLDEYLQSVDTATQNGQSGATFADTTDPACTVALPKCTTNTLVANAVSSNYLWADSRHFGVTAQSALGSLALTRATNNPF